MARYIDVEKVHIPKGFFKDLNVPKLLDWLNSQPTADVVEVVRCKDCGMSRETEDESFLFCMQFADTVGFQAFCSYGERKCNND